MKRTLGSGLVILGALTILASVLTDTGFAQDIEFFRHFGGDEGLDMAYAVDASGNVYISGSTWGAFPGQTNAGWSDAFVRRCDADGNELWIKQFGDDLYDGATAICVSGSEVYVVGTTSEYLPSQPNIMHYDAFVRKYDTDGNELWARQFGTETNDYGVGVCVSQAGVYVGGYTFGTLDPDHPNRGFNDAFVRSYDADGTELWTKQFGTEESDYLGAICCDLTDGIYAVGQTRGAFLPPPYANQGLYDAFVRKYDTYGNEKWTDQFGTENMDAISGVSCDLTGVYTAGYSNGALLDPPNNGSYDSFVRKYDSEGNQLWTEQFGGPDDDVAKSVSCGPIGVYVGGYTHGEMGSADFDVFACHLDEEGYEIWTQEFGTDLREFVYGVSASGSGVYIVGYTYEGIANVGDAFVARLALGYGPLDLLYSLVEYVTSLNLQHGIENGLDSKLNAARKALEDLKDNNDLAAVNTLKGFVNEVNAQRGQYICDVAADELVARAEGIIYLLVHGGGGGQAAGTPQAFAEIPVLCQSTPNPFANETAIQFSLPDRRQATLRVYDISGRTLETLVDHDLSPGVHTINWKANVPAGTYFYRLTAGDFTDMKKMVVVR